jgi:hypothetical protein
MTSRTARLRRCLFILGWLAVLVIQPAAVAAQGPHTESGDPAALAPADGELGHAPADAPAPKVKPRFRAPTPEEFERFGLEAGTGACAGTFQFRNPLGRRGPRICTHGPDIAAQTAEEAAASATALAAAALDTPGIPCHSLTSSAPVVEVAYLYPQGTTSQLTARLPRIKEAIAIADWIYNQSAKQVSGSHIRHVPWRMSSCHLSVKAISVPASIFNDFASVHQNLTARGELASNEKVLAWHEGGSCYGLGQKWPDERATTSNLNNSGGMLAWVETGCLGYEGYVVAGEVAAHELGHTLGAVGNGSPHSSQVGHCWDESDVMCYADGGSHPLETRCAVRSPELLDCNKDDYFHTGSPTSTSYLGTHWNTARNRYLKTTEPPSYEKLPRPTVSISSPASGSAVAGEPVFTATAAAPVGSTLTGVEFFVNGQSWGSDNTSPYQLSHDTLPDFTVAAAYPNGTKLTLLAKATDNFGRSKTSAAATYTVSNPTVRLISPTYASRVSGNAFWSAIASAGLGRTISKVDLLVDGVVKSTDTTAPYNGTWNTNVYPNGSYLEVKARVTDSAGVQRSGPARAITVERPSVTLLNPPGYGTFSKSTTLVADAQARWGASISKVEFLVDNVVACPGGDTTSPYTCTFTPASPTTPDTFQIKARATDSAGGVTTSEFPFDHAFTPHASDDVVVTWPASGATLTSSEPVMLTATHASTATPTPRSAIEMHFFVDGGWVGSDYDGSDGWTAEWTPTDDAWSNDVRTIVAQATVDHDTDYPAYSAGTPVIIGGGTVPSATVSVPSTTVGKIVNVSASVAGGGTVNHVQFWVNGELIDYDFDGSNGWSIAWDTKTASDGFLALRAVADTANGTATSAPRYVSLLNLYGAVTAPANGATVSGTYQLKAFAAADQESAVEWVKWYVDGIHVGSDSTSGYALNWNSATVADGSHTIKARVFASDGRWRDSATWSFTVNN